MDCKVTFVNCGFNGSGVSVLASIDRYIRGDVKVVNRILFNVGDSTQRLCAEHKVKMYAVSTIVITSLAPHNISGFPGVFLALSDLGVGELNVYGPVGLKTYLDMMLPFINRKYPVLRVTQVEDEMEVKLKCCRLFLSPVHTNDESQKVIATAASLYPIDDQLLDFQENKSFSSVIAFIPMPYYFSTTPSPEDIGDSSVARLASEETKTGGEAVTAAAAAGDDAQRNVLFVFVPLAVASHAAEVRHLQDDDEEEEEEERNGDPEREGNSNDGAKNLENIQLPIAEEDEISSEVRDICTSNGALGVILPVSQEPFFKKTWCFVS